MNEEMNIQEETAEEIAAPEETAATHPETGDELVEVVGVRFKEAGKTYYFAPMGIEVKVGDSVIGETARGLEMGRVTLANRMVPKSETVAPLRPIVRKATQADIARQEENRRGESRAMDICREKIQQHNLDMSLVSAEYTFDNSKLLFYFTAENRVDFRELVKDLASVFKTRIELRQIGIRDEAKLMGGFGVCGRPFCCSSFLSDFVQVSIKMAKEQNFSLNSAKISGACGRLMCCLRYEHESYEDALKTTPSNGSLVSTPNGVGVVVETRPLTQTIKVRLEDKQEAPRLYSCSEVKVLRQKGKSGPAAEEDVTLLAERQEPVEEQTAQTEQKEPKGNRPRGDKPRKSPKKPRDGKPSHENRQSDDNSEDRGQKNNGGRKKHGGHKKKFHGERKPNAGGGAPENA